MTGSDNFSYLDIDIPAGFVHIYTHHFSESGNSGPDQILSLEEQSRANAYTNANDRELYISAHVFLREVLAHYLNISPQHVIYEYSPYGKPTLASHLHQYLHFNMSYRGSEIIVGVSSCPIGIDVEQIRTVELDIFSKHFFSGAECLSLLSIDDKDKQLKQFFRIWTLKEAFIKGTGLGVNYDLQSFSVIPGVGDPQLSCKESGWIVKEVSVPIGYVAAIAIQINENMAP